MMTMMMMMMKNTMTPLRISPPCAMMIFTYLKTGEGEDDDVEQVEGSGDDYSNIEEQEETSQQEIVAGFQEQGDIRPWSHKDLIDIK